MSWRQPEASKTPADHGKLLLCTSQPGRDLNNFLQEDSLRQWHPVPTLTHIKTVWPILGGLGRAQLTDRRTWKGESEGKVLTGHLSGEPASLQQQSEAWRRRRRLQKTLRISAAILKALTKMPTKSKSLAMIRNAWGVRVSAQHRPSCLSWPSDPNNFPQFLPPGHNSGPQAPRGNLTVRLF